MKRLSFPSKSLVVLLLLIFFASTAQGNSDSLKTVQNEKSGKKSKKGFFNFSSFFSSTKSGDNRLYEAIFRPMEFREPVVSIPAEGRYGFGFYGWDGLNPLKIDSTHFAYEGSGTEKIGDIDLSGRLGSFVEFELAQTNLSYLLFKKSYFDILTGFGIRYFSVLPVESVSKDVSGSPQVPSSWGVEKTFTPRLLEGNLITSFIFQWQPRWFITLKYSYGLNSVKFYRDDDLDVVPSGKGVTTAYSLGIRFLPKSGKASRIAWGFDIRHSYHKISNITDPDNLTPLKGFHLPSVGIYFSISSYYGGRKTIGDEGKKIYLSGDYVTAKEKMVEFTELYSTHARIDRARKIIEICNERIPYQLYDEGMVLKSSGKTGESMAKFVDAIQTADSNLTKTLVWEIETIVFHLNEQADSLVTLGGDLEILTLGERAGRMSGRLITAFSELEAKFLILQGKTLAERGVFSLALKKYSEALRLAPTIKVEIRRLELDVGLKMLEDVNKANDEASVRLALQSLYHSRDILPVSDKQMEKLIDELEHQLSRLSQYRTKLKMNELMAEARAERHVQFLPKVELGMLVSEVEDILGTPHDVVERINERKINVQLWIYTFSDDEKVVLTFEDYVLFKIENK